MKELREVLKCTEDILAESAAEISGRANYGPAEHEVRIKIAMLLDSCRNLRLLLKHMDERER